MWKFSSKSKDECLLYTVPKSKKESLEIFFAILVSFKCLFFFVYFLSSGNHIAVDGPLQFFSVTTFLGKETTTRALTDAENEMALYQFKNVKLASGFLKGSVLFPPSVFPRKLKGYAGKEIV